LSLKYNKTLKICVFIHREFIILVYILTTYTPIIISSFFKEVREIHSLPPFHFIECTSTNYVWLTVQSYWWVYKVTELIHKSSLIFSLIPTTLLCTYAHILRSLNKLLRLFYIFYFTIVLTISVDITTRILYSSQIRYPQWIIALRNHCPHINLWLQKCKVIFFLVMHIKIHF